MDTEARQELKVFFEQTIKDKISMAKDLPTDDPDMNQIKDTYGKDVVILKAVNEHMNELSDEQLSQIYDACEGERLYDIFALDTQIAEIIKVNPEDVKPIEIEERPPVIEEPEEPVLPEGVKEIMSGMYEIERDDFHGIIDADGDIHGEITEDGEIRPAIGHIDQEGIESKFQIHYDERYDSFFGFDIEKIGKITDEKNERPYQSIGLEGVKRLITAGTESGKPARSALAKGGYYTNFKNYGVIFIGNSEAEIKDKIKDYYKHQFNDNLAKRIIAEEKANFVKEDFIPEKLRGDSEVKLLLGSTRFDRIESSTETGIKIIKHWLNGKLKAEAAPEKRDEIRNQIAKIDEKQKEYFDVKKPVIPFDLSDLKECRQNMKNRVEKLNELKETIKPVLEDFVDKYNKHADRTTPPEMEHNIRERLYGFVDGYLENTTWEYDPEYSSQEEINQIIKDYDIKPDDFNEADRKEYENKRASISNQIMSIKGDERVDRIISTIRADLNSKIGGLSLNKDGEIVLPTGQIMCETFLDNKPEKSIIKLNETGADIFYTKKIGVWHPDKTPVNQDKIQLREGFQTEIVNAQTKDLGAREDGRRKDYIGSIFNYCKSAIDEDGKVVKDVERLKEVEKIREAEVFSSGDKDIDSDDKNIDKDKVINKDINKDKDIDKNKDKENFKDKKDSKDKDDKDFKDEDKSKDDKDDFKDTGESKGLKAVNNSVGAGILGGIFLGVATTPIVGVIAVPILIAVTQKLQTLEKKPKEKIEKEEKLEKEEEPKEKRIENKDSLGDIFKKCREAVKDDAMKENAKTDAVDKKDIAQKIDNDNEKLSLKNKIFNEGAKILGKDFKPEIKHTVEKMYDKYDDLRGGEAFKERAGLEGRNTFGSAIEKTKAGFDAALKGLSKSETGFVTGGNISGDERFKIGDAVKNMVTAIKEISPKLMIAGLFTGFSKEEKHILDDANDYVKEDFSNEEDKEDKNVEKEERKGTEREEEKGVDKDNKKDIDKEKDIDKKDVDKKEDIPERPDGVEKEPQEFGFKDPDTQILPEDAVNSIISAIEKEGDVSEAANKFLEVSEDPKEEISDVIVKAFDEIYATPTGYSEHADMEAALASKMNILLENVFPEPAIQEEVKDMIADKQSDVYELPDEFRNRYNPEEFSLNDSVTELEQDLSDGVDTVFHLLDNEIDAVVNNEPLTHEDYAGDIENAIGYVEANNAVEGKIEDGLEASSLLEGLMSPTSEIIEYPTSHVADIEPDVKPDTETGKAEDIVKDFLGL